VTLAPEPECFWQRGISYFYEDIRSLPLKDDVYDIVVSVSSLEHVGCDNTFYTHTAAHVERRLDDFVPAAQELVRVLKPGGLLLATVPFGDYQFHGAFQQFDRECLSRLEAAMGPAASSAQVFYRYTHDGWQRSTDADCAGSQYVAWVAEYMKTRRWPDPAPEPDDAAAARAVACLAMRKA
jgi:SAM-dependent methyltransferase